MDFNSYLFTLCFLPLFILVYFALHKIKAHRAAKIVVIVASLGFITYAGVENLFFLVISMVINYGAALWLKKTEHAGIRKLIAGLGVTIHLGILAYTKYRYFAAENLEKYLGMQWEPEDMLIPIGISFVTFLQIAYLVDVFRGRIEKLCLTDYILYVVYFPKYIQGPIANYGLFEKQINEEEGWKIQADNFAYGIWLFVTGLAKKILLADIFAKAVSWGIGLSIEHMTAMDAILVMLSFTFQIYFDFSGYSSMAIGIAKMMNISLPDNFDSPYQSLSVIEFWKRWHISLTNFLREYLYIPLGGNRKGKVRYYINMFLVFFISGIWHGASWTYIVWGALQGAAYCLNKMFYKQWMKLNQVLQWMITFLFINISWLFFRALSVSQAVDILKRIFRMESTAVSDGLLECFRISELAYLRSKWEWLDIFVGEHRGIELSVFMIIAFILSLSMKDKCAEKFKPTIAKCVATIVFFSWSIISFSTVVEYIYGGF